jgi:hypothetical protein
VHHTKRRVGHTAGDDQAAADADIGIHDVVELRGIRANLDSQDPVVEYRVQWKDGSPDTWCVRVCVCVPGAWAQFAPGFAASADLAMMHLMLVAASLIEPRSTACMHGMVDWQ